MLNFITILFAGFSLFTALILLGAYWFAFTSMRKVLGSKVWCTLMMAGLICLQIYHVLFFANGLIPFEQDLYRWTLLLMPITFYFFSRAILFYKEGFVWYDLLHVMPILIGSLVPTQSLPLFAFFIGSGYTLWFVVVVIRLREHSARFHFELFFFSSFAIMAALALFFLAMSAHIPASWFFLLYTNAISLAFALIITALLVFPNLVNDLAEIVESTYAKSQLGGIDTTAFRQQLENQMILKEAYKDEELNLSGLAELVGLTAHQLSELINTEYGYGFKRLVKEHRIREAKAILLREPQSSVLSVSMETGFKSQSAFYSAFKEIEGKSPGQYRSENL